MIDRRVSFDSFALGKGLYMLLTIPDIYTTLSIHLIKQRPQQRQRLRHE